MLTALEGSDPRSAAGEVRRLTGSQAAAIAVFRLSGRPAWEVAARHLRLARPRPLGDLPLDVIVFGHWLHTTPDPAADPSADPASSRSEDVVLCRVAPEVIELHTHGGPAVARSLCDTFRSQGITVVDDPASSLAGGAPADRLAEPTTFLRDDRAAGHATLLALLEPAWWESRGPAKCSERIWTELCHDLARADLPAHPNVATPADSPLSTAAAHATTAAGEPAVGEPAAGEPAADAAAGVAETLFWVQTQAAARLAQSQGGAVGQWLWNQLRGALLWELQQIARLAATNRSSAVARLDTLLATWSWGRFLERPIQVLITGPPNVGKSSLINALLGYQRAVVSPIPGTTRDLVQQATVIAGWEFHLTDSAGVRATEDDLEARGIQKIAQAAAAADLILAVRSAHPDDAAADPAPPTVPGSGDPPMAAPPEPTPRGLVQPTRAPETPVPLSSVPTLVLLNKIDLWPVAAAAQAAEAAVTAAVANPLRDPSAATPSIWPVSARTRQGLDAVVAALVATLLPQEAHLPLVDPAVPDAAVDTLDRVSRPGPAVVFCRSVYDWLHQWRQRLIANSPGSRT